MPASAITVRTTSKFRFSFSLPNHGSIIVMDIAPAAIAVQMAMVQQQAALSMIKQASEMQAQVADLLTAAASNLGNVIDIAA